MMKKIVVAVSFLLYQTIGHADFYNWVMNVKNNTPYEITLSCKSGQSSVKISAGQAGSAKGSMAYACQETYTLNSYCTYSATNGTQTLAGEIALIPNGTGTGPPNFTAKGTQTQDATNISSYACDYVDSAQTGSETRTCTSQIFPYNSQAYSYPVWDVTGYFTISSNSLTYELTWNNIKTNVTKGQIVALKLSQLLMKNGNFTSSTASYANSTIDISLFKSNLTSPYDGKTLAQCQTINPPVQ